MAMGMAMAMEWEWTSMTGWMVRDEADSSFFFFFHWREEGRGKRGDGVLSLSLPRC